MEKKRVLILCTGNSARSQMAEGLLRHDAGDRFEVESAGTQPGRVRPEAIAVMKEVGIDISSHRSKHVLEFENRSFDYVLTVCDNAKESCPVFLGQLSRIHQGFESANNMSTRSIKTTKSAPKSESKPRKEDESFPLLGAHMSIGGGPAKALERARSIGCSAIQIFVKNNMQWFAKPFAEVELAAYHDYPDRPKAIFGHASYLINPGATNPDFREKSIRALSEELGRAEQLGLPFLVLHPGAHMGDGEEAGLNRIVSSLDEAFVAGGKCRIALEITAGQGTSLGCTFEHLATIIERSKFQERLTICLDTAHLFAAGFDISTAKGFWDTLKKFDQVIGRDRLSAWHLNDSKTALGSRVDRHAHIGKGKIGLAPFREIMRSSEFAAIPKVLETPKEENLKEDVENMKVLRGLIA